MGASGRIPLVELPRQRGGEKNALIRPNGLYEALGLEATSRQAACRELFKHELKLGLVDQIRWATNGNFLLGNERFEMELRR